MITNHIKIAWRNIRHNKGFAILNIVGLSLGITCFLLLSAYILHEKSYDKFYTHTDRIAYVSAEYKSPEDPEYTYMSVTPTAVAPTLLREFAEVERAVRIYSYNKEGVVRYGDKIIRETNLKFADDGFFEILSYPFLEGDVNTALSTPYQIVLTKSTAQKYFANEKAVGEIIDIDGQAWKVSGIVSDPPTYTQIGFKAILSNAHLSRYQQEIWHSANDITLALLKDSRDFERLQVKANSYLSETLKEIADSGSSFKINIEHLSDVHLYSKSGNGNVLYVRIFMALAIAIIILACVNFTNLILARSAERMKEVGVKKVLGAGRTTIFTQFLSESNLMTFIAMVFGISLAALLLPVFANYIGVTMRLNLWADPLFYLGIVLFILVVALSAGAWPAIAMSILKPISTLKGKTYKTNNGFNVSKFFVVCQFCISILFIVCTFVAGRQLRYLQTKDTGLNRSQIIVLDGDVLNDAQRNALKNELTSFTHIGGVTASYDSPVSVRGGYTIDQFEGKNTDFQLSVTAIPVEKDFVDVFEIPVIAGELLTDNDISRARDTSSLTREYSFIINKAAAQALGYTPQDILGKRMQMNGRNGRIKTVTDDFNFASLKQEIRPIVIFPEYYYFGNVFVKINENTDMESSLASIEAVWKQIKPDVAFDYHFLDEDYAALYKHEQQTARTMSLFSFITILIACIGLFALSAYAAQQRIKEIGIRKVLGASVARLIWLLSFDFVKLVLIALVIAVPIASWVMHIWLQEFVFRIAVEWWVLALTGILTVGIAFMTVGSQAYRAATMNPVDSLRDE